MDWDTSWLDSGSSPHMRGTLGCIMHLLKQFGIIPAYAGNTTPRPTRGSRPRDHPRICGEHPSVLAYSSRLEGSSPHMRGTLPSFYHVHDLAGIIPAYAGNTWIVGGFGGFNGDHPRICGEHSMLNAAARASTGSSPHMRGTPSHRLARREHTGIIPAYAGNTWVRFLVNSPPEDHPRICGEHSASPPWWRDMGDHPRICGEHPSVFAYRRRSAGSSPHMRGTHFARIDGQSESGIIPAYAGNTVNSL